MMDYLISLCLIVSLLAVFSRANECSQSLTTICNCISTINGLRIDCIDRTLEDIMQTLDQGSNVDKMTIRHIAGIPEIPAQAFGSTPIRELDLAGNQIEKIDPNAFDGSSSHIRTLVLANNSLSVMPKLEAMTNLENVDLSNNFIKAIPDNAFSATKKLRWLRLRGNKICKLTPNALNETKERLEFLDLSHNCLDEVPAQNLRGSQKLQYLDLSHNLIVNVPSLRFMNLPSLVELRLNSNALGQLHPLAFMNVPNLEQLILNNNKLTSLDTTRFQSFAKLSTLDLSNNLLPKLASNAFQGVASLKHLILDDNRIESVETLAFSSLPALQLLSIQNNGLQRLYRNAFDALPALTTLLFTNNSLDDISDGILSGMPALQELILSNNRLTTLTSGSFESVTQLTTLDLSDNALTRIGEHVFRPLHSLFWLDLSGNQLSTLPQNSLPEKTSNILLQGNPLICNESIDWLVQYLVSNNVRTFLPNQNDVICADPPERRGTLLKDLMLQRANETYFNNKYNGPGANLNAIRIATNNLNLSTAEIASLNQANGLNIDSNGQPQSADLIKALPQLAALLGTNPNQANLNNVDLTKLPPEIIRYVSQGGQVPGVSKETMQMLIQRYIAQMAAKNKDGSAVNSQTIATGIRSTQKPQLIIGSTSNLSNFSTRPDATVDAASAQLPPLSSLSPELIQKVLNGGTIPGLTPEQTETIKRRYMQQLLTAAYESTTLSSQSFPNPNQKTTILIRPHPVDRLPPSSLFNFTDLQSLNVDVSRIPPDVLQDMAAGRTPDFGRIPQDIIRIIMDKRPMLFGEIVSRELRTRTPPDSTLPPPPSDSNKKRPSYDVNDLDKKADISVLSQDNDHRYLGIWTAVALGAIGTITTIAAAILCWRRRVLRKRTNLSRQSEDTSDTSRFFEQPTVAAPEPPPRRSKVKLQNTDTIRGNDNLMMFTDASTMRIGTDPMDNNCRFNDQSFSFDHMNRNPNTRQYLNASMLPFQSDQHFSSPPPVPNRPPAHTAVFDHSTGSWMFVANPAVITSG